MAAIFDIGNEKFSNFVMHPIKFWLNLAYGLGGDVV